MATRCKERVIAFRGTANLRDVRTDVQIWREKSNRKLGCVGGVYVHDGFADAFERVYEVCMEAVSRTFRETETMLITTGHSLGRALASMCALMCAALHPSTHRGTLRVSHLIRLGYHIFPRESMQ